MKNQNNTLIAHRFVEKPNITLIQLAVPVLLSLIVEPLTGLVDTAFISRLGVAPLAALGVSTITLSSFFWIFNFLNVGTQTEIAKALGEADRNKIHAMVNSALLLSLLIALFLVIALFPGISFLAHLMGASLDVHASATAYMKIRLLGTPAILSTLTAFGIFRGLQDMKTPFIIALIVNVLNCLLDPLLIFGLGVFPPLGMQGAALASVISQWIGCGVALIVIAKRIKIKVVIHWNYCLQLLHIGKDLFIRTGLLVLFLTLTTRYATKMSPEAGAAHQIIRQFWFFSAFLLDAFGIAGQSLVGYFVGQKSIHRARQVAVHVFSWSLGIGFFLSFAMLIGKNHFITLMVPLSAVPVFIPAWQVVTWMQPLSSLAFASDGIHWGTGDFAFLRNVVILATSCGISVLLFTPLSPSENGLALLWIITGGWVAIRGIFGILRIWPGLGKSPLRNLPPGLN